MASILSLASHDKSAHSTNQANLFDYTLVNHIAMYYERRFTNLGYSTACILQSLPYLRMLLTEFLSTELQVLAHSTHVVNLPFLLFVEVNSQEELLKISPCLFNNLKCGTVDNQQLMLHNN